MKRIFPILVGIVLLCGCSLSKRIARVSARIEGMYSETKEWRELPEKTITWNQAIAMLRSNNLELREADDRIKQSERQSMSVYTDMIPGLSYYGYMTRAISRLSDPVDSRELSSNINMTFSLPALTQIPYRVYAAKVQTFAAIKAKEGRERELISLLYQQVRLRELELAKRALEDKARGDNENEIEMEKLRLSRAQSDERYWKEVSRILGQRSARWNVLPGSMPHVEWEQYEERMNRLGELVVCQFAMRLEQARMAQYQVALRYLPTINTNLYSPSLFSSSGGTYQGTFLNGEDTRLSLSISYTLDTHLNDWDTYQTSKARYEREVIKVADELMDHKNKVQALRASMNEYRHWRSYMIKRMAYMRQQQPQTAEEYVERERNLHAMENELLSQEVSSVESEAAMVLEYGMPNEQKEGQKQ